MAGALIGRRGTASVAVGSPPGRPANDTRATAVLLDPTPSYGTVSGTTVNAEIEVGGPVQYNYPDPVDVAVDMYAVYYYWDDVPADTNIFVYVRPTTNGQRRRYFGAAITPGLPTDVDTATTWLVESAENRENQSFYYGLWPCSFTAYYSAGGPATLFVYSADESVDDNAGEDSGTTGPITFQIGWGFSDDPNPSHWLPSVTSTAGLGQTPLHQYDRPGAGGNSWQDWLVGHGYRTLAHYPAAINFHPDYVWGWRYTSTTGDLPTQTWLPYYGFDFWS